MIGFGTDGIRGRVGAEVTPEVALALGRAVVAVVGARVYVARDTRPSGPDLEEALVRGIVAAGGVATRLGVLPTPALAWICAVEGADAAIMLTASHNPAHDNGLKVFVRGGAKPGEAVRQQIEAAMAMPPRDRAGGEEGSHPDPASAYIALLQGALREAGAWEPQPLTGRTIALDAANGAAHDVAGRLLDRLGATVVRLGSGDGSRINEGCGALHPEALAAVVREVGADGGIALDGDGDRVVVIDAAGAIHDGDALLWIAARRRWGGVGVGPTPREVVGTVMTNTGLEVALRGIGVSLRRTPVGDEAVAAAMAASGATIGGEPSGHLMYKEGPPSADALYAALRALLPEPRALLADAAGYRPYTQVHHKASLADRTRFVAPVASIARIEAGGARVVVRPSGTEPVVRILVEHPDPTVAAEGAEHLRRELEPG